MNRGFTLIEVLIALCIIGVLSAIAVPGYSAVLLRAQRNEARLALLEVLHAQERHYQVHFRYTDRFGPPPQEGGLGIEAHSDSGSYLLSVRLSEDGQHYVAAARVNPQRRQAADRHCAEISLDDSGRRGATSATGDDAREQCW